MGGSGRDVLKTNSCCDNVKGFRCRVCARSCRNVANCAGGDARG